MDARARDRDLADAGENTPATEPAIELAAHLARPEPITFADGTTFQVSIELKTQVDASLTERHTPEQRALPADPYRIGIVQGLPPPLNDETFAAIEEYRPDIIVTNEPRLFRRRLER